MKRVTQASIIFTLLLLGSLFFTSAALSGAGLRPAAEGTPQAPGTTSGNQTQSGLSAPIYLPLVSGRGASVTGRVTDINDHPLEGVAIVDDSGRSVLTDASGTYAINGLAAGEHALAPAADGYVFWPSVVSLNIPSSSNQHDFTAIAACTNLVVNGSFEDGDAPWEFPITPYPADRVNQFGHTGAQSARTGILQSSDNVLSYSSTRQLINIPDDVSRATLKLWLYPQSGEVLTTALPPKPAGLTLEDTALSGDVQYVLVLDEDNNVLETLLWMLEDDREWLLFEFDLLKYEGEKIKIQVGTYNDGAGGVSALFVDDVSLEACPEGEPTPTPQPTVTGTLPACENQIDNSGFETTSDWDIPITAYTAGYDSEIAYQGNRSMRTGIVKTADNTFSYSDAGQWVSIPKNIVSATLKMRIYPVTEEATLNSTLSIPGPSLLSDFRIMSPSNDVQYVLILNQFEEIVEILLWQLSNKQSWVSHEFDLAKYAGSTIKIQFGTFNTGGGSGVTAMYVDEVTLEACPSGVPTATPTITPTPTQTPTPTNTPTPTATLPPSVTPSPTATLPPGVTPTASATPSICSEGIENGGFEETSDWVIPITEFSAGYSTAQAHAGERSMRTGIIYTAHNRYSYSDARQVVTIPASAEDVLLRLWIYPLSEESSSLTIPAIPTTTLFGVQSLSGDVQYVIILDWFGNWIDTLLWERSDDQEWSLHTFDLSEYAGETIKVQFGTYNDGLNGVSAMYVDDASLQICP